MGETTDQTLSEIASARAALERDLATLGERMPPKEQIVKGAAVGGGALAALAGTVALIVKAVSDRREERALAHEAEVHARAVAAVLARQAEPVADEEGHVQVDLDLDPGDGRSGGVVAAVLAVLLGFAAAFGWLRRGQRLEQRSFEEAPPHAPIEPDLTKGAT